MNHHLTWTDPLIKFGEFGPAPRRIMGVVADVDDENVIPGPSITVYQPFSQEALWAGNLFVHTHSDPYALVTPITRIIRDMSVGPARGARGNTRRHTH